MSDMDEKLIVKLGRTAEIARLTISACDNRMSSNITPARFAYSKGMSVGGWRRRAIESEQPADPGIVGDQQPSARRAARSTAES